MLRNKDKKWKVTTRRDCSLTPYLGTEMNFAWGVGGEEGTRRGPNPSPILCGNSTSKDPYLVLLAGGSSSSWRLWQRTWWHHRASLTSWVPTASLARVAKLHGDIWHHTTPVGVERNQHMAVEALGVREVGRTWEYVWRGAPNSMGRQKWVSEQG